MTQLEFDPNLGQRRRVGPAAVRSQPVVDDIEDALRSHKFGEAALLIDHFVELAAVRFTSYNRGRWLKCRNWLLANGTPAADLTILEQQLSNDLATADGGPYCPDELWEELTSFAGVLSGQARIASANQAHSLIRDVEQLRASWQNLHDKSVDYITGMLTFVVETYGEAQLGDCMQFIIDGTVPGPEDGQLTMERVLAGMVGHLSGPKRRGSVQVSEHDDRWILEFEPCGSGGRSYLPDLTHQPAKNPIPNDKIQGKYDWAWNTPGVCYYCTHCAIGLQTGPIDVNGAPFADVYPPVWNSTDGDQAAPQCRYVIYKQAEAIPEAAFQRVGKNRPDSKPCSDPPHLPAG